MTGRERNRRGFKTKHQRAADHDFERWDRLLSSRYTTSLRCSRILTFTGTEPCSFTTVARYSLLAALVGALFAESPREACRAPLNDRYDTLEQTVRRSHRGSQLYVSIRLPLSYADGLRLCFCARFTLSGACCRGPAASPSTAGVSACTATGREGLWSSAKPAGASCQQLKVQMITTS